MGNIFCVSKLGPRKQEKNEETIKEEVIEATT